MSRLRAAVAATLLVALGACSNGTGAEDAGEGGHDAGRPPTSQETYSYAGCEDAGAGGCPNQLVLLCALDTIERSYPISCTSHSECTFIQPNGACSGAYVCMPIAARSDTSASLLNELSAEIGRYCATATCQSSAICGVSHTQPTARCRQETCEVCEGDGHDCLLASECCSGSCTNNLCDPSASDAGP